MVHLIEEMASWKSRKLMKMMVSQPLTRHQVLKWLTRTVTVASEDEEDSSNNAGERQTSPLTGITTQQQPLTGEASHDDTADDAFQFSQNPPMEHDPPFRPAEGRFC